MVTAILIVAGLFLIALGIGGRLGYFKTLYLFKGVPLMYPSGYVYAFIPAGLGSLFLAFIMFQPNPELWGNIVIYVVFSLLILCVLSMAIRPRWLRPRWLRWLEENYKGNTLDYLLEEARETWNFNTEPKTQEDVEIWARKLLQQS